MRLCGLHAPCTRRPRQRQPHIPSLRPRLSRRSTRRCRNHVVQFSSLVFSRISLSLRFFPVCSLCFVSPCPLRQRRRAKHGSLCRRCNNPRRRNLWRPLLPHFEHHHSLLLGCRIGPHCTCKNTASLCSNLCCNWLHRVFDYWPHTVILCSTKCAAVLIEPPYK